MLQMVLLHAPAILSCSELLWRMDFNTVRFFHLQGFLQHFLP